MARSKRRSRSCGSVRRDNLDRTLKDLERMNGKMCSKSATNIHFSCCDQPVSKSVRFDTTCAGQENFCQVRQICSDEQVCTPLWQRSDFLLPCNCELNYADEERHRVRRSNSEGRCDRNSLKSQCDHKNSKFFGKLKKFWRGIGGKEEHKKPIPSCLRKKKECESKRKQLISSSSESCASTTSSEGTDSEKVEGPEFSNNEHIQEKTPSQTPRIEDVDDSEQESKQTDHVEIIATNPMANLKCFWEQRNGLSNYVVTKSECGPTQAADEECQSEPCWGTDQNVSNELSQQCSTETLVAPQEKDDCTLLTAQKSEGNCFLNYKTSPICCSLDSTSASCKESESCIKKTIRCLKKEMAQRKRLQKMELNQLKEEMRCLKKRDSRRRRSSRSSSCSWSSTTPECGSLCNLKEASGSSCSSPCNPACSVVTIRSSNECIRTILNGHPSRSIPHTSRCDIGKFYIDNDCVGCTHCTAKQPSKCSQLNQQYSVNRPIWTQPNECIRTILNGHPCRSIPHTSRLDIGKFYRDNDCEGCTHCTSKCSQLKQQYSLKCPIWSQPVSRQQQPNMEQCSCNPNCNFEEPTNCCQPPANPIWSQPVSRQQQPNMEQCKCNPKCNFEEPTNCCQPPVNPLFNCKLSDECIFRNCDCDPTNWLWNQIICDTPCTPCPGNDSIITCYVNMYRIHAAEAAKRKKRCIIDPLEFRYGYQNDKHGNGIVNVSKKGEANVVWSSKTYGNSPCSCQHIKENQASKLSESSSTRSCSEKKKRTKALHCSHI